MTVAEEKYEVFNEIWGSYLMIKDILIKAGIPEHKHPVKEKLEKTLHEFHINKFRDSLHWINYFTKLQIGNWKKIRAENTEEYWEKAELFGFDDEFEEVKLLKEAAKTIRKEWVDSRNVLVKEKKKRVKKDGQA